MNGLNLFQILEHAYTQTKYWHQQTTSYAEHKALGGFYEALSDLSDEFLEVYIGLHGRTNAKFSFEFTEYSNGISVLYLKKFGEKLYEVKNNLEAGCLQNLIDEMTALVNRTIYLLSLK